MRFKRHVELEKGHLDMIPLINVIFLLLIFFMLTYSFVVQPGIRINLPKAITSEVIHEKNMVIIITSENLIYLNEKILSIKELSSMLQTIAEEKSPILIKADRKASLGRVVEIWDLCRTAGISQINIATSQETQ